ncbi:MAG: SGNH/GDSL hydrolase family protein [Armatimonadetes bacterium]|nr:SGNH/GDSL hydrolase family protein [Armatimonadota bacterium]
MELAPQDLRDFVRENSGLMWAFTGDSITHGALHTLGYRDYTELIEERCRYELGRVQDLFVNSGISGDNSRGLLEGFEHRISRFQPDLVSLMIGMNDCSSGSGISPLEFGDNLRRLIDLLQAKTRARVILNTQNGADLLNAPERSAFPDYMQIVREVGAENGVPVCDHLRVWGQVQHTESHRFFMLLSDPIHPNQYGHRLLANTLLNWFDLGPMASLDLPASGM